MKAFGSVERDQVLVLSAIVMETFSGDHGEMISCMERVGSIFIQVKGGLQTFGEERQMEREDFFQRMEASSLVSFVMAGVMAKVSA